MSFKRTQLRELYGALHALKQSEQVALAEFHASDVSHLLHRIDSDLKTVAGYPSLENTPLVDGHRTRLPDRVDVAEIPSGAAFAAALLKQEWHEVVDHPELSFKYVEREPSPLRGSRLESRHMDLLLLGRDGQAVLSELKRGRDNLPYYALIQLLMHLVELSSASQRRRLSQIGIPAEAAQRPMDLYLLAYGEPHKTYVKRSLDATSAIAEKLMKGGKGPLRGLVRRIVYLHASPNGTSLRFVPHFIAE